MTRGDAWGKHLLREKPSTENFDDEGYHVRYEDGYESWSPVKPFEEAYKCADSFLDRLVIEQKDWQQSWRSSVCSLNLQDLRNRLKMKIKEDCF